MSGGISHKNVHATIIGTVPLPTGSATAAHQVTQNTSLTTITGHVDGIEASLTSILAKIIAAPATEAKQDTVIAALASIFTSVDGVEALLGGAGAVKDAGPSWTPVRALLSSADASAAGDLSAAPTAGQKIVIDDWWFSTDTAMRIDLLEETSGTVLWSAYLPANGSVQFTPRDGLKLDTADKKVRRQTSAAGNVRGVLLYHSAA